ncbi:MAG: hypothetical protein GDA50_08195 [Alphaproteobacteria bacterium GM202ARS2]|nr:hypothetical protein [Alphaproteobacteria bacterium GM202ARS2]
MINLDYPPTLIELMQPVETTAIALGRLDHALDRTFLYPAFLWRENVRIACKLAQISGYQVTIEQLGDDLLGLPQEHDDVGGLAAARRHFITAEKLFRRNLGADSIDDDFDAWPDISDPDAAMQVEDPISKTGDRAKAISQQARLDDGPSLVTLLQAIRKGTTSGLERPLVRFLLPLCLYHSNMLPRPLPGLIGGRLPLGGPTMLTNSADATTWIRRGLMELTSEADRARSRLLDLERQVQAWQDRLAKEGMRKHAHAPHVVDLLTIMPAITAKMVKQRLGISQVAASAALKRLAQIGIVREPIARQRFKIFTAADLKTVASANAETTALLKSSQIMHPLDYEAMDASLAELFADVDRVNKSAKTAC